MPDRAPHDEDSQVVSARVRRIHEESGTIGPVAEGRSLNHLAIQKRNLDLSSSWSIVRVRSRDAMTISVEIPHEEDCFQLVVRYEHTFVWPALMLGHNEK